MIKNLEALAKMLGVVEKGKYYILSLEKSSS
jgi:hypothetical protein